MPSFAVIAASAILATACSSSGASTAPSAAASSGAASSTGPAVVTQGGTLNIDYATYNPLSLVIKDQGWLEKGLADQNVTVNWVKSAGSNKANEALRANAIDVGSTAGSAALLARSNGSPIQVIDIYSQPEWAAIVVPKDSADHVGRGPEGQEDRRHQGHRPVLLPSPGAGDRRAQADRRDGRSAPARRWLGGPPERLGRRVGRAWTRSWPAPRKPARRCSTGTSAFNSYGFLNATESFIKDKPDLAQAVVDAYEQARAWAQAHPDETAAILAAEAGLDTAVASKVIKERSNLGRRSGPG